MIAVDYDPTAQKVAEEGFALAKAMGAETLLLHVISDPVYYSSTAYSPIMGFGGYMSLDFSSSDITDELRKTCEDFLDQSKKHLNDANIQTLVKEGNVATSILETTKEVHADIVVMGSHSRKWLDAILIGSVAKKVLHDIAVPLFIIPTKQHN